MTHSRAAREVSYALHGKYHTKGTESVTQRAQNVSHTLYSKYLSQYS